MSAGNAQEDTPKATATVPISEVRPVVRAAGFGAQVAALAKYMTRTEVHTYAFSVAANVILSLFPFIVMMMTISRQVFHSVAMARVVGEIMSTFLPSDLTIDPNYIMDHMLKLAYAHKGVQVYSVVMLLISSTGVFMPLEVALNGVWGVSKNRSYLWNQIVSLGLAFSAGVLAMISVALTTGQKSLLAWMFLRPISNKFLAKILVPADNLLYKLFDGATMHVCALAVSILIFFLIYWILPNRKVPARAVMPTAIVMGLLWEAAKYLYVLALPKLDFQAVYGPFYVSVGLMIWAFLSGLLLLAGAHFSATRYALSVAREEERKQREQQGKENDAAGA
ncbi:MAG: YihY/virulence factor BrkB family protein [Acidobacteriaceae bacterium]|jgi:YihY family inner membrane protein